MLFMQRLIAINSISHNRASFLENADNIGFTTPYAVCREVSLLRSEKSSSAKVEDDLSELMKSQETLLMEAEKQVSEQ
jgi:hypothetical protein